VPERALERVPERALECVPERALECVLEGFELVTKDLLQTVVSQGIHPYGTV
jgi:hypothetical protein